MNYRTTKKRIERFQTITEYDNNNKLLSIRSYKLLLLSPLDKDFDNPRKNKEKHFVFTDGVNAGDGNYEKFYLKDIIGYEHQNLYPVTREQITNLINCFKNNCTNF